MEILSRKQHLGLAAILLAASAFLSRLMGLVRDKIISWQFGASHEADMYFAAFVIPDIINYLLAGGFMSITIIPLLARSFQKDEADAWKFFSCIFFWMLACACAFTGACEILAPLLAKAVAPGFTPSQCIRLAFFMRIILPAQVFFLGGACFTALLLLRQQFAAPALTPLIYNGLIILGGLLFPFLPGGLGATAGMTGYCIGVTLGAALGAFFLPFAVAAKGGLKIHFAWRHPLLKKYAFVALPLMLGQTVVMLDEQFLRVFGSMLGEGGVSLLNYGRRIAQVPVALMGQALAAASYPFLVKLLAKNDEDGFNQSLNRALSAGLRLIIPCALFMIIAAGPILGLIFQGGRFGHEETAACVPITRVLLAATPFWIVYMVLARAFYAHSDTLTPAITGTIMTIICIPLYYLFAVPLGPWAIAAVSGFGVGAYTLWLFAIWIKRHGAKAFAGLLRICWLSVAVSALPAILAWLIIFYLPPVVQPHVSIWNALISLIISGAIFLGLLLILAARFSPELFAVFKRLLLRRRPAQAKG